MISLLKMVEMPWEKARGYLRIDLQHIESAMNQRWNATFGDANQLQSSAVTLATLNTVGVPTTAQIAARVSLRC